MITIKSLQQTFFFLEIEGQLVSLKPNEQIIIDETKLNARQLKEIINLTVEDKIELLDYSLNQLKDKLEELSPLSTTSLKTINGESIVGNGDIGVSTISTTDDVPEGSSNLYFTSQRVRDTTLTGLSTATATPITATDTVLTAAGKLQAQVNLKLDAADYNDRFLGLFSSVFDLEAAHPTASAGDYAQVDFGIGTDVIVYAWDVSDQYWSAVGSSAIANTDALPEGSSNLYLTGQRVRDTPLTGLSTATATPITAADTVLVAAGKLQAQVSAASQTRKFPVGFWANQHQLPLTLTLTHNNTLIVYMFFLLPHAITINQIGYGFGTSQSPSQTISARFYDLATGAAATPQIDLTGGGFLKSGAITPQTLQEGAYVVAVKPSQVADFVAITSTSCPLFPTVDLRGVATAKQTVLAGAALPATFPSSGLTYDNSSHPAINFFVSA